jgi:hypothetical protein
MHPQATPGWMPELVGPRQDRYRRVLRLPILRARNKRPHRRLSLEHRKWLRARVACLKLSAFREVATRHSRRRLQMFPPICSSLAKLAFRSATLRPLGFRRFCTVKKISLMRSRLTRPNCDRSDQLCQVCMSKRVRDQGGIVDAIWGKVASCRKHRKADYQSAARCHLAPHRPSGLAYT